MPFAGYESFDACVTEQLSSGHDEDSARRICGSLQAEAEKGADMPVQIPLTLEVTVKGGAVVAAAAAPVVEPTSQAAPVEKTTFQRDVPILKATIEPENATLHYVLGIVLEPNPPELATTKDTQGDTYTEADIRAAAYGFMKDYRTLANGHANPIAKGAAVVESYVTESAFEFGGQQVAKGTWLMRVEIDEGESDGAELWKGITDGTVNAFSIGGEGERVPLEQNA